MPSDDTPLEIEGGNELPARDKHRIIIIRHVMRVKRPAAQTYKYSAPTACQSFNIATVKRSRLAPRVHVLYCKGVSTKFPKCYSRVMEINHPGGELMRVESGGSWFDAMATRCTSTVCIYALDCGMSCHAILRRA